MTALAFIVAVAHLPGIFASPITPRWWAMAIGLPLVSRLDPRKLDPPILWLLLFALAYAAGAVIARQSAIGVLPLIFAAVLSLVFVAGAQLERLDGVMVGMTAGLAVSVALCVPQLFGWSPVAQGSPPAGLFYNRDVLAETCAPVFVWWCFRGRRGMGPAVILAGPVLLSRSATLAALVALLYTAPIRLRWKGVLWTGMIALAVMSLWGFGPGRLASGFQRLVIWKIALGQVTLTGRGVGWFEQRFPMLLTAHSDLLQAFVEMGAAAVALAAIPLYVLTREPRGEPGDRAALVAICVEAVVSFPLHMPATAFLGMVCAGFMCRRVPDAGAGRSAGRAGVVSGA